MEWDPGPGPSSSALDTFHSTRIKDEPLSSDDEEASGYGGQNLSEADPLLNQEFVGHYRPVCVKEESPSGSLLSEPLCLATQHVAVESVVLPTSAALDITPIREKLYGFPPYTESGWIPCDESADEHGAESDRNSQEGLECPDKDKPGELSVTEVAEESVRVAGQDGVTGVAEESVRVAGQDGVTGVAEESVGVAGQDGVTGVAEESVREAGQDGVTGVAEESVGVAGQDGVTGVAEESVGVAGQNGMNRLPDNEDDPDRDRPDESQVLSSTEVAQENADQVRQVKLNHLGSVRRMRHNENERKKYQMEQHAFYRLIKNRINSELVKRNREKGKNTMRGASWAKEVRKKTVIPLDLQKDLEQINARLSMTQNLLQNSGGQPTALTTRSPKPSDGRPIPFRTPTKKKNKRSAFVEILKRNLERKVNEKRSTTAEQIEGGKEKQQTQSDSSSNRQVQKAPMNEDISGPVVLRVKKEYREDDNEKENSNFNLVTDGNSVDNENGSIYDSFEGNGAQIPESPSGWNLASKGKGDGTGGVSGNGQCNTHLNKAQTENNRAKVHFKTEQIGMSGKQKENDLCTNRDFWCSRIDSDDKNSLSASVPIKLRRVEIRLRKLKGKIEIPISLKQYESDLNTKEKISSKMINNGGEKKVTINETSKIACKVEPIEWCQDVARQEAQKKCDPQSETLVTSQSCIGTHSHDVDNDRGSQTTNGLRTSTCNYQSGPSSRQHLGKCRISSQKRQLEDDQPHDCRLKAKLERKVPNCIQTGKDPVDDGKRMRRENAKQYKCNHCGDHFKKKSTPNGHKGSNRAQALYLCKKCTMMESKRTRHRSTPHCISGVKKEQSKGLDNTCKRAPEHDEKPGETNKWTRQITKPTYKAGTRLHRCPLCDHGFRKKTDLQRHERVHSGEKPHVCKLCEARFNRKFALQCHENTHKGIKPHSCGKCGKKYSRHFDLAKHVKLKHTKEFKFVCPTCGKAFVTSHNLLVHERVHTNSQPYVCPMCGHRSNHLTDLKKHIKSHNQKLYPCKSCSMVFRHSSSLKSHEKKTHEQL